VLNWGKYLIYFAGKFSRIKVINMNVCQELAIEEWNKSLSAASWRVTEATRQALSSFNEV